jgi:hypothetical protein
LNSSATARFHNSPEEAEELSAIGERLLRAADAVDILPTPLDQLYAAARVRAYDLDLDAPHGSLRGFLERAGGALRRVLQKVRGITDLRERVVYIPQGDTKPRERFVRAHELSHNVIPWQRFEDEHIDETRDLTAGARRIFDQEANYLAAEFLFQGERFKERARSYAASMNATVKLARLHGTSHQATLWKYAEVQDERVVVAMYYPSKYNGNLERWKAVPSPAFRRRFPDMRVPEILFAGHPWRAAIDLRQDLDGEIILSCGSDGEAEFRWEARWNGYALFILLRRMPQLAGIGRLIRGIAD